MSPSAAGDDPDPAAPAAARLPGLDLLRGAAVGLMVVYHLSWDLTFLRLADWPLLTDPGWLALRTLIVGAFLFVSGASVFLMARRGLRVRAVLRRLGAIAAAAALISLATWAFVPDQFVFFGILHCIVVASVLGLPFVRLPAAVTLAAAGLALAAPALFAGPAFDRPGLRWLGLVAAQPHSVDYVPLLPWFGVFLAGLAAMRLTLAAPTAAAALAWQPPPAVGRPLSWAGRHSLPIYLLHQPVLIAALVGVVLATGAGTLPGRGIDGFAAQRFLADCAATCRAAPGARADCARYCRCALDGFEAAGAWGGAGQPADPAVLDGIIARCRAEAVPPPG